jgi:hypothetical protein
MTTAAIHSFKMMLDRSWAGLSAPDGKQFSFGSLQ